MAWTTSGLNACTCGKHLSSSLRVAGDRIAGIAHKANPGVNDSSSRPHVLEATKPMEPTHGKGGCCDARGLIGLRLAMPHSPTLAPGRHRSCPYGREGTWCARGTRGRRRKSTATQGDRYADYNTLTRRSCCFEKGHRAGKPDTRATLVISSA